MTKAIIIDFIMCFIATVVVDVLWTYYIRRVSQGKAFAASIYGGLVAGFGVYVIILYTSNNWLGIAVVVGSVIGTYIAVKLDTKKRKEKK